MSLFFVQKNNGIYKITPPSNFILAKEKLYFSRAYKELAPNALFPYISSHCVALAWLVLSFLSYSVSYSISYSMYYNRIRQNKIQNNT